MPERHEALSALQAEFSELFSHTRALYAAAAERVAPGLPPGAYVVFARIVRHGPLTARELSESLSQDKAHMSRTVKALVDAGLVAAEIDPADRRSRLLVATEAGRERYTSARSPMHDQFDDALADWTPDDMRALQRMLRALRQGIAPRDTY